MEDTKFTEKIIEKLYSLAKKKDVKICDLEAEMEFTTVYLKKIEKNNSSIGAYAIKKAADFFGVTVDYLLSDEQERERVIVDENKLVLDYLHQMKRLTDSDKMVWEYEDFYDSSTKFWKCMKSFEGNETDKDMSLCHDGPKLPFMYKGVFEDLEDTEKLFYVSKYRGCHGDFIKTTAIGTYYARIPETSFFLAMVLTYYDEDCECIMPDVLLTDYKEKIDVLVCGLNYEMGEGDVYKEVSSAIQNLHDSIKTQWSINNGRLSRQTRGELNRQLQMFSKIKITEECE